MPDLGSPTPLWFIILFIFPYIAGGILVIPGLRFFRKELIDANQSGRMALRAAQEIQEDVEKQFTRYRTQIAEIEQRAGNCAEREKTLKQDLLDLQNKFSRLVSVVYELHAQLSSLQVEPKVEIRDLDDLLTYG